MNSCAEVPVNRIMKGKGKGGVSSERSTSEKSESKDCPLNFPELKPIDHTRQCPRYTAVLSRSESDGIGVEELDTLQTELEILWAAVAKRERIIEAESNILLSWLENRPIPVAHPSTTATKPDKPRGKDIENKRAGKGNEEKSLKKFKDATGKAVTPPVSTRTHKGKVQNNKSDADTDPKSEVARVPRNDASNRFWALIEPYCQELVVEDLRVLEDLKRSHEDDADYYKIPALGKHFSIKWATENLLEEQKEGAKGNDNKQKISPSAINLSTSDAIALLKKGTNCEESDDESSPFGPLTQRLVSALIEENIMSSVIDDAGNEEIAEAASMSPKTLAKQLNIGNSYNLERKLRQELEEQGILESEVSQDEILEDEILTELQKKQQDLKAISHHNLVLTNKIYKLAKEELNRQELRRKMATVDADILDAYRKVEGARAKKRTPTKKERDAVFKALKEREQIIKSIEALSTPS